jgi:hypothetical protein
MLRSMYFLALAGAVTSHSLRSFSGISVPGRLQLGLESGTPFTQQQTPYKEES